MAQFSIKALFVVVLVAALFTGALVNPSYLLRQVIVTLTFSVLVYFILLAVLARSRSPFVLGFAVAGLAYFVLVFCGIARSIRPEENVLLTGRVLNYFVNILHEDVRHLDVSLGIIFGTVESWEKAVAFTDIGHCLFTLIFGSIGGLAGTLIAKRERRPTANKPKDQP